jgi:hypothetical protein
MGFVVKRRKICVPLAAAALVLGLTTHSLGEESHEFVEETAGHGYINWSQGIIYAKGMGAAPDKSSQKAKNASQSPAARADAYSNLLEAVMGVRIDSASVVRDLVEKSNMVRSQLEEMVKRAEIVKREYLSDGMAEVTLAFKLTGGFAQLALPQDIMPVPEIRTIPRTPAKERNHDEEGKPSPPTPVPTVYTGLTLDARGLDGRPAMSPRIVSENGDEVYGSAYVSREFAVQHGMAAYGRNLKVAHNNTRVSSNPLTVRGLRTVGPGRCDFVVSSADAWKIRSASKNLLFLKQCRVIIVLD